MSAFLSRSRFSRAAVMTAAVLVAAAGGTTAALARALPGGSAGRGHSVTARADFRRVCALPARQGVMSCMALIRTDITARTRVSAGRRTPVGYGYGPPQLQNAYSLPSSTAGAGQTVAVVDAYDDPTAASDLAVYRASWGLPPCAPSTGAGCLTKVNQNGNPSPLPPASGLSGWATEVSLDVDMVSAICPKCHILLVEGYDTISSLGTGVNSAVRLGARFVSNSYGGGEAKNDPTYDTQYYKHPGAAITASSGDNGYGVEYPAASQYVTAVGGTSLTRASSARGWTETAWSGTGSGCSQFDPKPAWQTDKGCGRRTNVDVAAVADPNTGVAVYDSYDQFGWIEVGGTSVASPIIASVYALAGSPAAGTYPASFPYRHTSNLYDVTSGSNARSCSPSYLCTAGPGYDGPTGWGTPDGTAAFSG